MSSQRCLFCVFLVFWHGLWWFCDGFGDRSEVALVALLACEVVWMLEGLVMFCGIYWCLFRCVGCYFGCYWMLFGCYYFLNWIP